MMAGRSHRLGGALVGDLLPVLGAGCWTLSGFQITTGSLSSMMGRGAMTGGGVGAVGGTFAKEECSQGLDCGELIGWGFLHSLDCLGEAGRCVEDPVGGCDSGDWDGVMVEPEGVGDVLATGVGH